MFDLAGKKVFVAGHRGMVGSAVARRLAIEDCEVLTVARDRVDLRNQAAVNEWFADHRPEVVFLGAAKVGGILANDTYAADFLHDNLIIQSNVMAAAHGTGTQKLLFLGSSCIYPKLAPQPMKEEALLTGSLEPTNEWYAIAKIAGLKLVQAYRKQYGLDFISAMPTNLYGPNDNFDLDSSHVLPALLRKFPEAKHTNSRVTVWGSGTPRREFLHVDDCADACVFLLKTYSDALWVNVGTGVDISIKELARIITKAVGYEGDIEFDSSKPDGTARKLLDVSRLSALGWSAYTDVNSGVAKTYAWFLDHLENFRGSRLAA